MKFWPFNNKTKTTATQAGGGMNPVVCVQCGGPIKSHGFEIAVTAVIFEGEGDDSLLDNILYGCPSCKGRYSQVMPTLNEWRPCKAHAQVIARHWEEAKERGLWWAKCKKCAGRP